LDKTGRQGNATRRYAMGDKGKRDKDKARKQKIKKQEQTQKKNVEKEPTKILDRMNAHGFVA
jgi:hypothetical protein